MKISKEAMDLKTARVVDLIKSITDQERFDRLTLKLDYLNKYRERVGDTAITLATDACVKDGTCYINNTRSWGRGMKPKKMEPVAPPLPFEEMPNNDMDRFKARSCATLQGVEQLLKAVQVQNERLSRMEDMLSKVQRIVGEHLEDATNAYGSEAGKLDAIFKLVKHLTDEFDGVKP